ncbi:MAG TPA: transcriptional regulator [Prevotella sp.]|nr:transcriptional regulator [Prevotella sp.]
MEKNQTPRILDLLLELSSYGQHTTQQLAESLGVTRRNIYNYLGMLTDYGFKVRKDGHSYYIDPLSPFFKKLRENIQLSDTEAEYICQTLAEAPSNDIMAARVRTKLARHYGLDDIAASPEAFVQRVNTSKALLRKAIKTERIVKIVGYSSPHSHTVKDRFVEPYMFLNNGHDVRCHEISTHTNKTFKLSRMQGVELMDDSWFNKKLHKDVYTDIFMFSGEETHPVKLRLGQLSHNLLLEECPLSREYITAGEDGKSWTFAADMASFLGIGRFVIGLYDDIEVLGDDSFIDYLNKKVETMKNHSHANKTTTT